MSDTDSEMRVGVLDLIISVLQEHEKTLSESIDRLEEITKRLKKTQGKRLK